MPPADMILALLGICTVPRGPAATIFSLWISTTASCTGGPPLPSTNMPSTIANGTFCSTAGQATLEMVSSHIATPTTPAPHQVFRVTSIQELLDSGLHLLPFVALRQACPERSRRAQGERGNERQRSATRSVANELISISRNSIALCRVLAEEVTLLIHDFPTHHRQ